MDWCGLFGLRGGAPRRAKRGGSQWESGAEGVGVSVKGRGRLFAREHRAVFPPRLCGLHRLRRMLKGIEGVMLMLCAARMQYMVCEEGANLPATRLAAVSSQRTDPAFFHIIRSDPYAPLWLNRDSFRFVHLR